MGRRVETRPLPETARPPITAYGLIGDGHSAALIAPDGAIDFWCPQRFDKESVFLRLLDPAGGTFQTSLALSHRLEVGYLPETNVHRTRLVTAHGSVALTTFMPYDEAPHPRVEGRRIMRLIECEAGRVDLTVHVQPKFDYARAAARLEPTDAGIHASPAGDAAGHESLTTRSTLEIPAGEGESISTHRLERGERHAFILHHGASQASGGGDVLDEVSAALDREVAHWRGWVERREYDGPYEADVVRSLLALKLLQHVPSGSFVAAPTFSLPERVGGDRNWDYRYTWLRDSAFIVMAFETTGYKEDALRFRRWLARVVKRDSPEEIRPMYCVDGEPAPGETILDHLQGYGGSRPVRIGNRAVHQKQLDVYGDVMICFHRAPILWQEEGAGLWAALRKATDHALANWEAQDSGIWEDPGLSAWTYSKGMVWLALHRALDIADKQGFEGPRESWTEGKARIESWWRDEASDGDGALLATPSSATTDAANLLFPIFGITQPDDPSVEPTLEKACRDLVSHDLAHRYFIDTDIGAEGAFVAVNFWLAEDLARLGRTSDARRFFEAARGIASPLGLLPEMAEPVSRAGLGNHPLGLSHYSLVLSAYAIGEAESRAAQEAHLEKDPRRQKAR